MNLVLEIEYLAGVCFAAVGPDSPEPDWPPQPDRVFSALVATWAARGERAEEARAIEYLESLPQPEIHASSGWPRSAPISFVPPNDPRSEKKKHAAGVLPLLRQKQPRRFPAFRPVESTVRCVWPDAALNDETIRALQNLAHDCSYVGHSASLTRCRFATSAVLALRTASQPAQRWVYPGRFSELKQRYAAGRRPLPGATVSVAETAQPAGRQIELSPEWLLLEHVGGAMPDVRAAPMVAKLLRDALLSGYQRLGLNGQIPLEVSGHEADGSVATRAHLAILPMSFAGYPYADGHVLGFALAPPSGSDILRDGSFVRVLRELAPFDAKRGRRVLTLQTRAGTTRAEAMRIELSPSFEAPPDKQSLNPALYSQPARDFATVTPIVLDHHLKKKGVERQAEMEGQIGLACARVGLPEPELVFADKHSALEGAVSAYRSSGSPHWMNWRLPRSLASRALTHAVIRFPEPVQGPVILGAGRFVGMGLCRPLPAGVGDGE